MKDIVFGKLVNKRNTQAFSFLELVIVMAIVGILLSIAVPNLIGRKSKYERKQFIDHANALLQVAWQDTVVTHKLHKITFDISKRIISVDVQTEKKTATGDFVYAPMSSRYLNATYNWPPDTFEIKNFYVNSRDEFNLTLSDQKGKIWFFILPDGLVQPVIINMLDIKDAPIGQNGTEFSLVLNPFTAQFKEYDVFQKPE